MDGGLLGFIFAGSQLVNDSLIDYSVDYYKEHASEPLLSAYFVKAIYMGDSRKGWNKDVLCTERR